jgi:hypothetical protein
METALTNGTAPGLYVREGDDTSDWETYRQVLARRVEEATLGLAVWRALTSVSASPVERQQLALIVRCALGLAHRAGQPEPPPVPVGVVPARQGGR